MAVMGMVADATGKRNIEIGRIEIFKSFTLFEVDSSEERRVMKGFETIGRKGASVRVSKVTGTPRAERDNLKRGKKNNRLSA